MILHCVWVFVCFKDIYIDLYISSSNIKYIDIDKRKLKRNGICNIFWNIQVLDDPTTTIYPNTLKKIMFLLINALDIIWEYLHGTSEDSIPFAAAPTTWELKAFQCKQW